MNSMMNNLFQQMQQMQTQGFGATPEKPNNPFWYRENTGYLVGVTNMPSNPMLGIENIILTQRNGNQPMTLVANGRLVSIVGQITFQVFVSGKTGAPYVSTISTKNSNNTYYEHILLKPQVKAQILRYFEAWAGSSAMNQTQPMNNMSFGNNGFGMQFMQQPQMQVPMPQPQVQQQPQMQQADIMQMMFAQMQQQMQQMAQAQPTANAEVPAENAEQQGDDDISENDLPI